MQLEEKNFSNVLCVTDSNNRTTESYWLKGTRGSNQKASLLKKTVLQKKKIIVYAIPLWIYSILDVFIKKIF